MYLRITDYQCDSGGNGRPLYSLIEDYHVFYLSNLKMVSQLQDPEKLLAYAAKSAAYRYVERGTGVLY